MGGLGVDDLYGGEGADTFKWDNINRLSTEHRDIIKDFEPGVDQIDLSDLGMLSWNVRLEQNGDHVDLVYDGVGPADPPVLMTIENTDVDDLSNGGYFIT